MKIFCITIGCVTNICTFIFDSKEKALAKINVQNLVTQENVDAKFLVAKKNACKNKSSKIFDYLVRVHNDQGLKLCGRESTSKVYNWNKRTKASSCTAAIVRR